MLGVGPNLEVADTIIIMINNLVVINPSHHHDAGSSGSVSLPGNTCIFPKYKEIKANL